jgi:starvation-inducible DNA-binding protein
MNELIATAKIVLGNTFVMYFKAHSYHWNVEGKNFSQYHDFFGDIYKELHGAIDIAAEEIRALDAYAPISLEQLYNSKTIVEDSTKPESCFAMISNLLNANDQVILSLNKLFAVASAENDQGVADFAASRLDIHKKHGWMLRSFLKSGE